MGTWDAAVAALVLRTARPRDDRKPDPRLRKRIPAIDDAGAALNNRRALDHAQAALIASLWPAPTGQCVAAPRYMQQRAPAEFGRLYVIGRANERATPQPGARALLQRLESALGARREETAPAASAKNEASIAA